MQKATDLAFSSATTHYTRQVGTRYRVYFKLSEVSRLATQNYVEIVLPPTTTQIIS